MRNYFGIIFVILLGALLGVVGARYVFVNSGLSLVPWGIAGLLIGYLIAGTLQHAAALGAAYGFGLAFTFMVAGYAGAQPLSTRLIPFAILGIIGAVCGTALAIGGMAARRFTTKYVPTAQK